MLTADELIEATKGILVRGPRTTRVGTISIDSRSIKDTDAFVAIRGENFDGHDFVAEAVKSGARVIVAKRQAGTMRLPKEVTFIAVKDTRKALGDIANFWRRKFNIPVIAVTGSAGKTTAKEMIAWVLSGKYTVLKNEGTKNNAIGVPLTLLRLNRNYDVAVLEIGTSHFGEVASLAQICQPSIGIITNVGPVHLEFFGTLGGVLREKYSLIENLKHPAIALLNTDDPLLKERLTHRTTEPFALSFGIKSKSDFSVSDIRYRLGKLKFCVNGTRQFCINTLAAHHAYNALIAVAVARLFGMGYREIAARLSSFNFPQGRFVMTRLKKVQFIDDTYNSNPLSLSQALTAFRSFKARGRKIFVMGDMLELGQEREVFHAQAGHQAAGICDVLITVGRLSHRAADAAKTSGFDAKNLFMCTSSQEAHEVLFTRVCPREGDAVLVKGSRAMKMEEVFRPSVPLLSR